MMLPTPVVAAVLTPFVLWRVYARVKRLTVRQRSQLWRHRLTLGLLAVILVLIGIGALAHPLALAGMAGGLGIGAALGLAALRKTVFERVGDEFYFTPYAPIGFVVAALFIGRLLYRAFEFYYHGAGAAAGFAQSPLTLLLVGIMAGYYGTCANAMLRWRKRAALN
jgi:hypothetical protein